MVFADENDGILLVYALHGQYMIIGIAVYGDIRMQIVQCDEYRCRSRDGPWDEQSFFSSEKA